jgi:exopolyphosphatase/guanosine-5'-triphosphate,3'-diphosphate pyrophosphatase
MSIAQGAYHKHSAYILANADMPGFSRQEQGWIANVVLAQRGKLDKMGPAFAEDERLVLAACSLRLAVIFYRSRRALKLPKMAVARKSKGFRLEIDARWLEGQTLVALALEEERAQWESVGLSFDILEA